MHFLEIAEKRESDDIEPDAIAFYEPPGVTLSR